MGKAPEQRARSVIDVNLETTGWSVQDRKDIDLTVSRGIAVRGIADALDEWFSDLEAGVAALEQVRTKLKLYRASVLKAAVEGALTADWREQHPDAEPASELLQRILTTRRRRWEEDQLRKFVEKGKKPPKNWKAKYKEPVAPNTADLPALPEGWCWATVAQTAKVGTGATPGRSRKSRYYNGGSIPWVTSKCVNSALVLQPSEFVTERALAECNLTVYPPGTLLLAMYGEGKTRGKCAELRIESTTNQALAAIQANPLVKKYLRIFFTKIYQDIRQVASGGVQPNLNLGVIRGIAVPLPPNPEQAVIVKGVEDQLSVVQHLEANLNSRKRTTQNLRQSILKQAFSGKLVPPRPERRAGLGVAETNPR